MNNIKKDTMKKNRKTKQRLLQLFFAVCLILFILVIELISVQPSGIYSYTQKGYKEFQIGASKQRVLKKIKKRKTIRTLRVCNENKVIEVSLKKRFDLAEDLGSSVYWICHDRKGKDFLFLFNGDILERVLLQRLEHDQPEGSILFSQCNPEMRKKIDTYLTEQENLTVFYDTDP